jgi:hypothetical protein
MKKTMIMRGIIFAIILALGIVYAVVKLILNK